MTSPTLKSNLLIFFFNIRRYRVCFKARSLKRNILEPLNYWVFIVIAITKTEALRGKRNNVWDSQDLTVRSAIKISTWPSLPFSNRRVRQRLETQPAYQLYCVCTAYGRQGLDSYGVCQKQAHFASALSPDSFLCCTKGYYYFFYDV